MKKVGHTYLLKVFSTILSKMSSVEDLDKSCQIIRLCMELKNLSHLKSFIKNQISQIICGKIVTSAYNQVQFGEHVFRLLDYLAENELINPIYNDFVTNQAKRHRLTRAAADFRIPRALDPARRDPAKGFAAQSEAQRRTYPAPEGIGLERDVSVYELALIKNLFFLFDLNSQADNYFKKNYGYSLLDLEGNIIWADKKTCTIFDLKKNHFDCEHTKKNLFDLMIPYSKNLLEYKYSSSLFGDDARLGQAVSISYVIYSRVAMEKFRNASVQCLMGRGGRRPDAKEPDNFTKYLKSVSSRATLTRLSYTRNELQSLMESDKCQFEKAKVMVEELQRECGELAEGKAPRSQNLFIFLETRLSSEKPQFDYGLMDEDEKIKEFKEEIQLRIDKQEKKKKKMQKSAKCARKRAKKKLPNPKKATAQGVVESPVLESLIKPRNFSTTTYANPTAQSRLQAPNLRLTRQATEMPREPGALQRASMFTMGESVAKHRAPGEQRMKSQPLQLGQMGAPPSREYLRHGKMSLGKREGADVFPKPSSHNLKKSNQF